MELNTLWWTGNRLLSGVAPSQAQVEDDYCVNIDAGSETKGRENQLGLGGISRGMSLRYQYHVCHCSDCYELQE